MIRSDFESAKGRAAFVAAEMVQSGMVVGLGTGSTARLLVERLGERVALEGLNFRAVATSVATAEYAASLNIAIVELDTVEHLDLNIDGADEVDPEFRLIKGLGGALLREKIVCSAARRRVTIVDASKRVERLGTRAPVPIEVSPFGFAHVGRWLATLGASIALRSNPDGSTFATDGGHRIFDCHFGPIADPGELDARIQTVPGAFDTGIFVDLCDCLIVGHDDGVQILERPTRT